MEGFALARAYKPLGPPRHNSCRLLKIKNPGTAMKDICGTLRTIIQRPRSSSAAELSKCAPTLARGNELLQLLVLVDFAMCSPGLTTSIELNWPNLLVGMLGRGQKYSYSSRVRSLFPRAEVGCPTALINKYACSSGR